MKQYEVTCLPGLEQVCRKELESVLSPIEYRIAEATTGSIVLHTTADIQTLTGLRTATAVYQTYDFPVARPKALLGNQNFSQVQTALDERIRTADFRSFRLDAAGSNSPVMRRLRHAISEYSGLADSPEDGQLQIRIKRCDIGWRMLLRVTTTPLSARSWRVCDMPGALNACIAAAMIRLLPPAGGTLCNLTCGSGTLLIEATDSAAYTRLFGIDSAATALECCRTNLHAAGCSAWLLQASAGSVPLQSSSVSSVVSDLPWGERIGRRTANKVLYSAVLNETSRVLHHGGHAVFLTQHISALDECLQLSREFREKERLKVFQKGYWPTIVRLERI